MREIKMKITFLDDDRPEDWAAGIVRVLDEVEDEALVIAYYIVGRLGEDDVRQMIADQVWSWGATVDVE